MTDTFPSVLIVTDDRDLAGALAASVLRLGYRQTSVQSLTRAAKIIADGAAVSGVTLLALSAASDQALGLVRTIAAQAPHSALVAAVEGRDEERARVAAALDGLMPVVAASDEAALGAAMRSARQASRATVGDRRRVWELQIANDIFE